MCSRLYQSSPTTAAGIMALPQATRTLVSHSRGRLGLMAARTRRSRRRRVGMAGSLIEGPRPVRAARRRGVRPPSGDHSARPALPNHPATCRMGFAVPRPAGRGLADRPCRPPGSRWQRDSAEEKATRMAQPFPGDVRAWRPRGGPPLIMQLAALAAAAALATGTDDPMAREPWERGGS